jgi:hypothetical protein
MAEHVLLVSARDIHHCGGLGGLIALVSIQVCGYQLLRRNDKGDFERSSSGVIGGTDDDQLAGQIPIEFVNTRPKALPKVFVTLWEDQANVEQALRSVTSQQILKMANEKYSSFNALQFHVRGATSSKQATFKRHPYVLASYVPINWNPGPSCAGPGEYRRFTDPIPISSVDSRQF